MKKALFILPLLLLAFLLWRILASSGEFAGATSVDQWRIGNMSQAEATRLLRGAKAEDITVRIGEDEIRIPGRYIKPDTKKTLQTIPEANVWQRISGTGGGHYPLRWRVSPKSLLPYYKKVLALQTSAQDASWVWSDNGWKIAPAEPGIKIDKKKLWRDILLTASLGGGSAEKSWKTVSPERSARDLRKSLPTQLLVDQSDYKLYVYRHGKLQRTYSVAVGAPGSETPNGDWTVLNRAIDPAWLAPEWAGAQAGTLVPGGTPENPLVSRWMGIGDGVGIHGTRDVWSLGSQASRGCIRMDPAEVEELYEIVPVGTPLRIQS